MALKKNGPLASCIVCNKLFNQTSTRNNYCSRICSKKEKFKRLKISRDRWRKNNKEKASLSNKRYWRDVGRKRLLKKYNLTEESLNELYKFQDYKCAICGSFIEPFSENKLTMSNIDHNHDTEKVRGLLCQKCNQGLGLFKDSAKILRKAAEYLDTKN